MSPESDPADVDPTKRIDGRWVLFGFPAVIFGIALIAAIVLQHWRLVGTLVTILVGWGLYLGWLEFLHRRDQRPR